MTRYLIRRTLQIIPLMIAISIVSFLIIKAAPGDPLMVYIDPNKPPPSAEDLARLRAELGLDQPLHIQYLRWLGDVVLKGNLGFSLSARRPVVDEIGARLPNTILLGGVALVVALVIAAPVGIATAVYRYSFFDYIITTLSFIGISMPGFFLALLLMQVFAVNLRWLPTTGMRDVRRDYEGFQAVLDVSRHLVLPVVALSTASLARWVRYQRSSVLDVLSQDYIRTARAKGAREGRVLRVHALRNALIPMVTLVGLSIPQIVSGSFITEFVFGWPGMGLLGVNAALKRDFPVIMGVTMLSAIFIVLGNFLADIMYHWVDPRIRYG
ncbi:MAG: ABC transporter permease [Anaerolineae bacterium]|nr:ABC transporter permease [Anaerolineae bacterium]